MLSGWRPYSYYYDQSSCYRYCYSNCSAGDPAVPDTGWWRPFCCRHSLMVLLFYIIAAVVFCPCYIKSVLSVLGLPARCCWVLTFPTVGGILDVAGTVFLLFLKFSLLLCCCWLSCCWWRTCCCRRFSSCWRPYFSCCPSLLLMIHVSLSNCGFVIDIEVSRNSLLAERRK